LARKCACVSALILTLSACDKGPATSSAAPPAAPSVVAVQAKAKPITHSYEFVGRVVAVERVDLRARVQGFLNKREFTEGQEVAAEDVLFLIEPDQYESIVRQREADLAKAVADEENARAQYNRGKELLKTNAIAVAKVDELRAAASVAKASIAQQEAAVAAAKLDLGYTKIIAPIDGRIGLATYTIGNLVGPESGVLATIVKRDPIYVQFPVTQRQLLEHRKAVSEKGGDPSKIVARVRLADGSLYEHPGRLNFLDVTTDRGTDTVMLRGWSTANTRAFLSSREIRNPLSWFRNRRCRLTSKASTFWLSTRTARLRCGAFRQGNPSGRMPSSPVACPRVIS